MQAVRNGLFSLQSGFSWHCRTAWTLRKRPDITHYVSPTSYIVPSLLGQDGRMIPVVHDLIAFRKSLMTTKP